MEPPYEQEEPQAPFPDDEQPMELPFEQEEPQTQLPPVEPTYSPPDMVHGQIAQPSQVWQGQNNTQYPTYSHPSAIPLQYNSTAAQRSNALSPQIAKALGEYTEQRRKRYLYGTIFLGIGLILFVLLWLVVVYDVLASGTNSGFGIDVVVILACAGIFFIFGLYMILTYPKSSLDKVLASQPRA
jgi:hypothetical protein